MVWRGWLWVLSLLICYTHGFSYISCEYITHTHYYVDIIMQSILVYTHTHVQTEPQLVSDVDVCTNETEAMRERGIYNDIGITSSV